MSRPLPNKVLQLPAPSSSLIQSLESLVPPCPWLPSIRAATERPVRWAARGKSQLTPRQAAAFVRKHGVVLESASGPVPSLAVAIAGGPIRGSWWSHPRSHEIFELTQAIRGRDDVLVCRLVDGKVTFVHCRLWPALVRAAKRFPKNHLAQVHEVHTASGRHVAKEIPFPRWVPAQVIAEASRLQEVDALRELGDWCA